MKFKNIRGYSNGKIKFKNIQDFRRPVRTLISTFMIFFLFNISSTLTFVFSHFYHKKQTNSLKVFHKIVYTTNLNSRSTQKNVYIALKRFYTSPPGCPVPTPTRLSIARYSFTHPSELGHCGKNEKAQASKQEQRGVEQWLPRLRARHYTAEVAHST